MSQFIRIGITFSNAHGDYHFADFNCGHLRRSSLKAIDGVEYKNVTVSPVAVEKLAIEK